MDATALARGLDVAASKLRSRALAATRDVEQQIAANNGVVSDHLKILQAIASNRISFKVALG
jgi:hypothetical protein